MGGLWNIRGEEHVNHLKGSGRVIAAALGVAVLLSACGGGPDRSAAPADSGPAASQIVPEGDAGDPDEPGLAAVEGTYATYVSVENRLDARWASDGIPITWRVTDTENRWWDGRSRPDHAPPEGFQGLVQAANSGAYVARLELSGRGSTKTGFVLTPVATVEGQQFALSPITFRTPRGTAGTWEVQNSDVVCSQQFGRTAPQSVAWTERTPQGLLAYSVELTCPSKWKGPIEVLIQSTHRG